MTVNEVPSQNPVRRSTWREDVVTSRQEKKTRLENHNRLREQGRTTETKMALLVGLSALSFLLMLVSFRLYVVLKAGRNCPFRAKESFAVVIVAGSGGHTSEVLRLTGSLSSAFSPRYYVVADTDRMSEEKISTFENSRGESTSQVQRVALLPANCYLHPFILHSKQSGPQTRLEVHLHSDGDGHNQECLRDSCVQVQERSSQSRPMNPVKQVLTISHGLHPPGQLERICENIRTFQW
ncbi:UDP-N-acetylglucosamine transferase subunit ALG14 -like protein [Takifugu flavidus]|uniref:UDP-N-acetylglucosamine transferase subunit ALG14 n=1 Tax=Takifugu flavidus TaxID=433684 RepID=A0A5C6NXE9_9TELE|nr:UDP-N-acetylglucosamine transferase subunit ALG14 -like protein [Takifugu flavidus]